MVGRHCEWQPQLHACVGTSLGYQGLESEGVGQTIHGIGGCSPQIQGAGSHKRNLESVLPSCEVLLEASDLLEPSTS